MPIPSDFPLNSHNNTEQMDSNIDEALELIEDIHPKITSESTKIRVNITSDLNFGYLNKILEITPISKTSINESTLPILD